MDAAHYPEIYYSDVKDFALKRLTDFSAQLEDWKISIKEPIKWKSKDGTEITGVLIRPVDLEPKKKYPLLVILHGGPASISYPQYLDSYYYTYPIEQWVAKGAVILEPNYRGSTGFGEAFRKLNYRNLGIGDYQDVISGVDFLGSSSFFIFLIAFYAIASSFNVHSKVRAGAKKEAEKSGKYIILPFLSVEHLYFL